MENRPRIKLKHSFSDRILIGVSCMLLIAMWIYTFFHYSNLPDSIPVHFDASGMPTRFGHKASLFALPSIATVQYVALSVLNKYPHVFNYPISLNAENAERQYRNATQMMRWVNLMLLLLFSGLVWRIVNVVRVGSSTLDRWFLPVSIVLLFLPIVYFLVRSSRIR